MAEEKKKTPRVSAAKATKTAPKAATKTVVAQDNKGESMHTLFSGKYHYAAGKRKSSVARVRVYEKGKGEIIVNGKPFDEYFRVATLLGRIKTPLKLTATGEYSITAKIIGGGVASQADALRHGIAKALLEMGADRLALKKSGQLTRDDRVVERKKPGRRKARRAHQWVKR